MTEPTSTRSGSASTGELVSQLSSEVSTLIRDELQLAQAEMTQKTKKAGVGAGLFGGAGLVGLYGIGALVTAAILGLAVVMDPWLAALIVGVALLAIAGLVALRGKRNVSAAAPPVPEQAITELKADVQTVKESASR
jgi:tetrahydromethanopterin S-methyltransferase subunit C